MITKPFDKSGSDNSEIKLSQGMGPVYSESAKVTLNPDTMLRNKCVSMFPGFMEIEFYKILRTQIQTLTKDKGWNTIMVTSPRPGEGKTLTSINTAITFAKEFNQTVLLVDCDLRMQKIHQLMGYSSQRGLVDYLEENQKLEEIITWPGIEKLTLISGGRKIQDSTELLGSPRMKALVNEMKTRYPDRYIFFDAPPILFGADAIVLASLVDCFFIVVEDRKTQMDEVKEALELLPKEKFLGFVINKHRTLIKGYDEYYGYGRK